MLDNDLKYYCPTCKSTMRANEFYLSKRTDRYPDGALNECKKCITRHVNNWDPKTFCWILEEIDVPFIEEEWNKLIQKYCQDRTKVTGTTVLGRYLSKMKLVQFRNLNWDDTEKIKAKADAQKADAMARQGYSGEEIAAELALGGIVQDPLEAEEQKAAVEEVAPAETIDLLEPEGFVDDLTEEDKTYLTIKWGRTYKSYEWVQLEKYYQEMMQSFDIQTPSHEDYLKLICKTSLKCHQLVDIGDIENFQKMSRVYDTLMKSSRFTAAQNKADNGEFVNSISEFVLLCEKEEGFIPRYYTDGPQDKADQTLKDLRGYTHSLITEEHNLGDLIEGSLKALQRQAETEEDEDIDDEDLEWVENTKNALIDEDFQEHYDFLQQQAEEDDALMKELLGEGEE